MSDADQSAPDPLADEPFAYRTSKDGKIFITWNGKTVMILKDAQARQFMGRLAGLDAQGIQMALAKITGNFKRGNERR